MVEETAATSAEADLAIETDVSTANPALRVQVPVWRPGLVVASAVLLAALSAGGSVGPLAASSRRGRDQEEYSDSITAAPEGESELFDEVQSLFDEGAREFFHDGLRSDFSRSLLTLLASKGNAALRAIARYVNAGRPKPDVVSEALRWLAEFDDPTLANERWRLLRHSVADPNPRVRDGAVLGFSTLDDPRALPILESARGVEPLVELQRLIETVIEQLKATAHATATANGQGKPLV